MIVGLVERFEAVIELSILDSANQVYGVPVVIDTSYNGCLTLPAEVISTLRLRIAGQRRAILADGNEVLLREFVATVMWHDQPRQISVTQAEGGSLVGMGLLEGCRLTTDVVEGGEVRIEKLPNEA